MKLGICKVGLAGLALVGAAWVSASAPVGDSKPIEHRFSQAPVNAMGVRSLADLRGKPVLVDFWGTR